MIEFEVKTGRGGTWRPVDHSYMLADGRVAWWHGGETGITRYWRISERTRQDEDFKQACRTKLAEDPL